jgi:hypothetical protein
MARGKRKKSVEINAHPAEKKQPPVPVMPKAERAFFSLLLREIYAGLQDLEQLARRPGKNDGPELPHKSRRIRATAAYALAALRMEESTDATEAPEVLDLLSLLNIAVNALRRDFLFAGVSVRRPSPVTPLRIRAPKEGLLFLLEEMLGCCLRCAPSGKNLHIALKEMPQGTLLSMRSEGASVQHPPLIPLPAVPGEPVPPQDYGFSVVKILAERLGLPFRWETDGAGVRLFLEIPSHMTITQMEV